MKILASVQAERTGRVYLIFSDTEQYYWARATPGTEVQGPFESLTSIYMNMSTHEGKTAVHWQTVFELFQTNLAFPATKFLLV
ncbi:MAG: hypothetical protein ACPG8W_08565 [Candidatus Promineifilaceae bacterium]